MYVLQPADSHDVKYAVSLRKLSAILKMLIKVATVREQNALRKLVVGGPARYVCACKYLGNVTALECEDQTAIGLHLDTSDKANSATMHKIKVIDIITEDRRLSKDNLKELARCDEVTPSVMDPSSDFREAARFSDIREAVRLSDVAAVSSRDVKVLQGGIS